MFHVRPATPDDHAFLVAANLGLARETEATELDESTLAAGVAAALADPGRGTYFIAEDARGPAGSLLVTREWSDWRNGWIWWIQSVYVPPERRRQGVYRRLHGDVIARARADAQVRLVRLYVDKDNERARATYLALGMELSRYDMMVDCL